MLRRLATLASTESYSDLHLVAAASAATFGLAITPVGSEMRTHMPALAALAGFYAAAIAVGIRPPAASAATTGSTSRPAVGPRGDEARARAPVALRLSVAAAKVARAGSVAGNVRVAFWATVALADVVRAGDFGTALRKLREAGGVLLRVADANVDVAFYGRVVDQGGDPVPGYRVQAVVQQLSLEAVVGFRTVPGPYQVYELATDAHGRFAVRGWGTSLLVNREQDGFVPSPRDPSTFTYDPTNGDAFRPDPARPVVFHVSRKN